MSYSASDQRCGVENLLLTDVQFHMGCECVLVQNQLGSNGNQWICPDHDSPVVKIVRPCSRCGETLETKVYRSSIVFCDDCNKILHLARTIYSQRNIKIFTDPILWRKSIDKIGSDLFLNMMFGYEEIQIDPVMKIMGLNDNIKIDIKNKIKRLKEKKQK